MATNAKSCPPLPNEQVAGRHLRDPRNRREVHTAAVAPGKPLALDEYDQIREQAARYVRRLGPVRANRARREPVIRLKDETQRFRGKTVQECAQGLRSEDVAVRRAAAWAISERGGQGALTVPTLVNLLDDPEVRMPAFRALEAIGPASFPALAKLKALLDHPDGFVRLGAT